MTPGNTSGAQTLVADGVSITAGATLMGTNALNVDGLHMGAVVFGYGGWVLSAPIIHAAHGNYLFGLGSFGLRAVLPVVGLYAGCALDKTNKSDSFACLGGATLGVATGATIAMALDAAVFGYTKPKLRGDADGIDREERRDDRARRGVLNPKGREQGWAGHGRPAVPHPARRPTVPGQSSPTVDAGRSLGPALAGFALGSLAVSRSVGRLRTGPDIWSILGR